MNDSTSGEQSSRLPSLVEEFPFDAYHDVNQENDTPVSQTGKQSSEEKQSLERTEAPTEHEFDIDDHRDFNNPNWLENFDFDSFLHVGDDSTGLGALRQEFGFSDGLEASENVDVSKGTGSTSQSALLNASNLRIPSKPVPKPRVGMYRTGRGLPPSSAFVREDRILPKRTNRKSQDKAPVQNTRSNSDMFVDEMNSVSSEKFDPPNKLDSQPTNPWPGWDTPVQQPTPNGGPNLDTEHTPLVNLTGSAHQTSTSQSPEYSHIIAQHLGEPISALPQKASTLTQNPPAQPHTPASKQSHDLSTQMGQAKLHQTKSGCFNSISLLLPIYPTTW